MTFCVCVYCLLPGWKSFFWSKDSLRRVSQRKWYVNSWGAEWDYVIMACWDQLILVVRSDCALFSPIPCSVMCSVAWNLPSVPFSCSVVSDSFWPHGLAVVHEGLGFPVLHQLPELAQTHVWVGDMPSNHLFLHCPLLLLPSIFPIIRVFSSESALCIRGPKYWSFGFSMMISFRIDWFDLLAAQGTLKSLLQHHSSKTSILWCSAFFMVQRSHPYMKSVIESTTNQDSPTLRTSWLTLPNTQLELCHMTYSITPVTGTIWTD